MTQIEAVILVKDPYYSISYFIKKKREIMFLQFRKGERISTVKYS